MNSQRCILKYWHFDSACSHYQSLHRVFIVQVKRTIITRSLQIGPMRKRALNFVNIISYIYILSRLGKLTHLFLSIQTYFTILPQWFLLYNFWMNYFLCLWHNVAMFFVSQTFISAPKIPYTLFFLLEQASELSLIHLSKFWALSISFWKFTYLSFVKLYHFLCYLKMVVAAFYRRDRL